LRILRLFAAIGLVGGGVSELTAHGLALGASRFALSFARPTSTNIDAIE
jgi:hypothetical protein